MVISDELYENRCDNMEVNIVPVTCKYCNDTGSYAGVSYTSDGEKEMEQIQCGCEFIRRHGIEDTTSEEE